MPGCEVPIMKQGLTSRKLATSQNPNACFWKRDSKGKQGMSATRIDFPTYFLMQIVSQRHDFQSLATCFSSPKATVLKKLESP